MGGLVFTSGQIGGPPPAQSPRASPHRLTRAAAMWALSSKLPAVGDKVVKTTFSTTDIATDFAAFNEVYARYFTSKPARSCVAVKDLPKGVLCEIEAIAEA